MSGTSSVGERERFVRESENMWRAPFFSNFPLTWYLVVA